MIEHQIAPVISGVVGRDPRHLQRHLSVSEGVFVAPNPTCELRVLLAQDLEAPDHFVQDPLAQRVDAHHAGVGNVCGGDTVEAERDVVAFVRRVQSPPHDEATDGGGETDEQKDPDHLLTVGGYVASGVLCRSADPPKLLPKSEDEEGRARTATAGQHCIRCEPAEERRHT